MTRRSNPRRKPRRHPQRRTPGVRILLLLAAAVAVWTAGCVSTSIRHPPADQARLMPMELTGYCNCGACCSWERTWMGLGSPVVNKGPSRGKPKAVGITSSGTQARHGTIAADLSRFPYGTLVEIPGYGTGRVEDCGSAIRGDHMDLWFPNHDAALLWGKQRKLVRVWLPGRYR